MAPLTSPAGMGKFFPYAFDSIIMICMIARLMVLLPRFFTELSGLRDEKTRLVGLLNNVEVTNKFIMKHLLNDSLFVLMLTFSALVLNLGYMMVLAERPEKDNTDLDDYENAIWVIIITMTTVGYGDTYPKVRLR